MFIWTESGKPLWEVLRGTKPTINTLAKGKLHIWLFIRPSFLCCGSWQIFPRAADFCTREPLASGQKTQQSFTLKIYEVERLKSLEMDERDPALSPSSCSGLQQGQRLIVINGWSDDKRAMLSSFFGADAVIYLNHLGTVDCIKDSGVEHIFCLPKSLTDYKQLHSVVKDSGVPLLDKKDIIEASLFLFQFFGA